MAARSFGIDSDTMEGRAIFGMLSVLAELQRELIVANTNGGLAAARARGRVGGRRPRQRFLLTLTILAHIVDAVVLVEAGPHSNTFATVNEARRIGKPVYAVPGPITSAMSRGTNQLLRSRKARVLTCAHDLKLPLLVSEPVAGAATCCTS